MVSNGTLNIVKFVKLHLFYSLMIVVMSGLLNMIVLSILHTFLPSAVIFINWLLVIKTLNMADFQPYFLK
jgi:hypothetical protein